MAEFMPEGFGDLSSEEEGEVMVFYGHKFLGQTIAIYDDDYFEFVDKKFLKNKLTMVTNKNYLINILNKKLATNSDYVCNKGDIFKCKQLPTKNIGLVFDYNKYQAYIYVNHKYLKPAEREKKHFLEPKKTPLAFLHKTDIYSYGDYKKSEADFKMKSILSKSNKGLVVASNFKTYLHTESPQPDNNQITIPSIRYTNYSQYKMFSVGSVNTEGDIFVPSLNLFGMHYHTDDTLLTNKNISYGTPIEVNLASPALIEILRNNQSIYRTSLQAGNHFLSTRSLPSGVYMITVKTIYISGAEKSKEMLFIKNEGVPALGQPEYGMAAGYPINNIRGGDILPTLSNQLVADGYYYKRLNRRYALRTSALLSQDYSIANSALEYIAKRFSVNASAAAANDGDLGFGGAFNYRYGKISFNWISRYYFIKNKTAYTQSVLDTLDVPKSINTLGFVYYFKNSSFTVNYSHQRSANDNANTNILGFIYSQPFTFKNTLKTNLTLSATKEERNWSYFVTLNFDYPKGNTENIITQRLNQDTNSKRFVPATDYTLKFKKGKLKNISLRAGIQENSKSIAVNASKNIKGVNVNANVMYKKTDDKSKNPFLYIVNLNHTMAMGFVYADKSWAWSSHMAHPSGALIKINSPHKGDKFTLINDNNKLSVSSNKFIYLPEKSLSPNTLDIISPDDRAYNIDHPTYEFTLYPNTVDHFVVTAKEIFSLMGNFYYPDHTPVTNAIIHEGALLSEIDEEGFGEVEAYTNSTLKVVPEEGGEPCLVDTSKLTPEDGMLFADEIMCIPESDIANLTLQSKPNETKDKEKTKASVH